MPNFANALTDTLTFTPEGGGVFHPETFTLDNGMQVVVVENHRAPVVAQMIWYKVGSADEEPGKSGIAHFLEHLMFKGTKTTKPNEFTTRVAQLGGIDNAFTFYDFTAYYQSIAKEHLPEMMRFEADRMVNLTLAEKDVVTERDVVIEERKQVIENNPVRRFVEELRALAFVNNPLGDPVIGWGHEIPSLSREDALAFYKKNYDPANAVLILAGAITAAEARPLVEEYYGVIPSRGDPAPRLRTTTPLLKTPRRLEKRDPQVKEPLFLKLFSAPSILTNHDESLALSLVDEMLGSGATSYLYERLVIDEKVATTVSSSYSNDMIAETSFMVTAYPAEGITMDTLETAVDKALTSFLESGITEKDLRRTKQRMQVGAVYARDSLQGPAYALGQALSLGLDVADVEQWPERIAAVPLSAVQSAAEAVFTPLEHNRPAPVTGLLLPSEND